MLSIMQATAHDANEIAAVHVASWRETYAGLLPQAVLAGLNADKRAAEWSQILVRDDSLTFVLRAQSKIVGFLSGGPARDLKEHCDAEVYALYLLKKFHHQGKGYDLCRQFWTRSKPEHILFWVLETNPTRSFYERLGGELIARKKAAIAGTPITEVAYKVNGDAAFGSS